MPSCWAGGLARGFGGDKGQCLTAGWAQRCMFWALYGATSPGDVLLEMLQKRLPVGGDERSEIVRWTISAKNARPVGGPGGRRCPAALARLDSGREAFFVEDAQFQHILSFTIFGCCCCSRLRFPSRVAKVEKIVRQPRISRLACATWTKFVFQKEYEKYKNS